MILRATSVLWIIKKDISTSIIISVPKLSELRSCLQST